MVSSQIFVIFLALSICVSLPSFPHWGKCWSWYTMRIQGFEDSQSLDTKLKLMADIKLEMEALMVQIKTKTHNTKLYHTIHTIPVSSFVSVQKVRHPNWYEDYKSDDLKSVVCMASIQYYHDGVSLDYYSKKSNSNNLVLHQVFDIQMEPS